MAPTTKARQTAARIGSPKAVVRLLGGFVGFMSRRTGGGLLGFREHATQVVTFGSVRDRRAMHNDSERRDVREDAMAGSSGSSFRVEPAATCSPLRRISSRLPRESALMNSSISETVFPCAMN